jgi:PAS domain S-box-containing protein
LTIILAVLLLISAILDVRSTRQELLQTLEEQGQSMMASVEKSIVNAANSFELVESAVAERLLTSARLLEELDARGGLTADRIDALAAEIGVHRVNVYDAGGNRVMTNAPMGRARNRDDRENRHVEQLLRDDSGEWILGFLQGRFGAGQRYAVAKRRRVGGLIVLNIEADAMLEFRQQIGAGKLLRDIGDTDGVRYVVLQDSMQVLMASANVSRVTSFAGDPFLRQSMVTGAPRSRLYTFEDEQVFEWIKPLRLEGEVQGVLRLGLNTDPLTSAMQSAERRVVLTSLLLLVIGVVVGNGVLGTQQYRDLMRAYRRIETYTGSILNQMTDAVVAMDREHRVTVFNPAAESLFQTDSNDVIGSPCDQVVPDLYPYLLQAEKTREPVQGRQEHLPAGDRERVVLMSIAFITDTDGRIETSFVVMKDMTDQKRLEENLRRRDQLTAMGHLASGVAHEIRNPLNAISMIAQRFKSEFHPREDEADYQRLADIIVSETHRISSIIQQFLQFARPAPLERAEIEMTGLVSEVVTLLNTLANAAGVELVADCSEGVRLLADPAKIKQVLINLIRNAIEATPEQGRVEVRCQDREGSFEMTISDTGMGMDADQLNRIFNLYYTRKKEGTGVGLSIVQQIVSQHNGTIQVDSMPGQGTTFTLLFPKELE